MKTSTIQGTMKKLIAAALAAAVVLSGGPAYVSASDGESAMAVMTEYNKAAKTLNKIALKEKKATLYAGEYTTIQVKKLPGDQRNYVKFKSDRKKTASVDSRGEVTAKKKGTAVITVTSKTNKKATAKFKLTVKAKPKKSSIAINKKKLSVALGKTAAIKVTKLAGVSSKKVTYTSSNPAVATVNTKGVVKGVGTGRTTITVVSAVNKKVKAKCTVTVSQAAEEISVPKQIVLEPGKGMMVNAMVLPGTVTDKNVTAVSADPGVAVAQAEDGGRVGIIAAKEGKTTVTVKTMDGKVSAAIQVTVKKKVVLAQGLEFNGIKDGSASYGTGARLPVGGTRKTALQVKVFPSSADNKTVYFYSDDTGIATVDQNGYVTGVGVGTCRICFTTCDGSNITQSCEVIIGAEPIMREKEVYAYLREHPEKKSMCVAMTPEMYAELEASMETRGYNKEWIADLYYELDGWHYVRGTYGDHGYDAMEPDGTIVYSYPEVWYWDMGRTDLAVNIWEE